MGGRSDSSCRARARAARSNSRARRASGVFRRGQRELVVVQQLLAPELGNRNRGLRRRAHRTTKAAAATAKSGAAQARHARIIAQRLCGASRFLRRLADRRFERHVLLRPVRDRVDRLGQRPCPSSSASTRRAPAFPASRCARPRPPASSSCRRSLSIAIGDVGNGVAQRREPAGLLQQQENDRAGPAAADQLAGVVEPRAELPACRWRSASWP